MIYRFQSARHFSEARALAITTGTTAGLSYYKEKWSINGHLPSPSILSEEPAIFRLVYEQINF
jgi:hypothetical protein